MTPVGRAQLFFLAHILLGIPRWAEGSCALDPVGALCGKPQVQPSSSRIVGGQEAQIGSWPWTVLLSEEGFGVCAGAIVNDRIILTAAHCFDHPLSRNASRWKVVAGKHHLQRTNRGEKSFTVQSITLHEDFNNITVENDIALMVLRERITFTTFIRPICLPSETASTALSVGQASLIAGWGDTKGTGSSDVLNQVLVPVVSDTVCSSPSWYYYHFIPQKSFCAGYEEGLKDACSGDSGGPLIAKFGDRWYASGLASWGSGCAEPKWPGIYTNVTYYLPWIHSRMTAFGFDIPCRPAVIG